MENTQLSHWNNKSCNKPIVKHSISRGTCKKLGLDRNPLSIQDSPRCVYDCLVNSKYIGSTFISFKFLLILLSYNTSLAQVHFPIFLQFLSSPLLYPTSIPSSSPTPLSQMKRTDMTGISYRIQDTIRPNTNPLIPVGGKWFQEQA